MRNTIITLITSSGGLPAKAAECLDELDQRYHPAAGLHRLFNKVFPTHWSFMLGEIALYRFIVLPLAGVDSHGHPIPPADQGAPVPKKMNQSDSVGSPVPGSLFPPPGWGDLCP